MVAMQQGFPKASRNSSRVISCRFRTASFNQRKSCSSNFGLRPHRWFCGSMLPRILRWASSFFTMCTETLKRSAISCRAPSPASYASTILCRKSIEIGFIDIRRYDGLPWEWLGIAPDIRIENTEAEILAGRDKQLEYAIEMLK